MSDQRPPDRDDTDSIRDYLEEAEGVSVSLAQKVRNSVERRLLAGDALNFSLSALFSTFIGYLDLVFAFMGGDKDKGES